MLSYKQLIYILKTNWVHLPGIYLCVEGMVIIQACKHVSNGFGWKIFLPQIIISAPFLIFTYGLMVIIPFYIILILSDWVLFSISKIKPFLIMLIEWVVITPVFIYWAITYHYWLWIALVLSFLITQVIRSRRINAILYKLT